MADVKTFMKLIKAMESSGGKDTKHQVLDSGIHSGDSAVGDYGIMPNTVKEVAKRRLRDNEAIPSDDVVSNLDNNQVQTILKENPELAENYTKYLAEKIMDKTKGDPELGMTGWHFGHNLSADKLKEKAKANPDYINKVDQRIYENNLQSRMPNLVDMLSSDKYTDVPMSKNKKQRMP